MDDNRVCASLLTWHPGGRRLFMPTQTTSRRGGLLSKSKKLGLFVYLFGGFFLVSLGNFLFIWITTFSTVKGYNFKFMLCIYSLKHGWILIVPNLGLLWHGTSVFAVSSKGPPDLVTLYDRQAFLPGYPRDRWVWVVKCQQSTTDKDIKSASGR